MNKISKKVILLIMQILSWVAIPDETEEDDKARNFTMDMGNKIMDGIWDMMEDN